MIVCFCHRVSDLDIVRAAHAGCASFDELQDTLRVGTACGACLDCAHETFHAAAGRSRCPGNAEAGLRRVAPPASRHSALTQPA